ncbi:MAG: glycosyltransferase [Campylobacterales bacterium]|nr:glycosyltransferase [Campylobacterales bacterium]
MSWSKKNHIKIIRSEYNLGFSNGNNLGIKQAKADGCEYIICTNSDILIPFQPDFISSIKKAARNVGIGLFSPNIVNNKGEYFQPRREKLSKKEVFKIKIFYGLRL